MFDDCSANSWYHNADGKISFVIELSVIVVIKNIVVKPYLSFLMYYI